MVVIFESGFETGNYAEWTGRVISPGCSMSIVSDVLHHGSYASRSYMTGEAGILNAFCHLNVLDLTGAWQNNRYMRVYVRFDSLPVNPGSEFFFSGGVYTDPVIPANMRIQVGIANDGGVVKWVLKYWGGPGGTFATEYQYVYSETPAIEINRWYCLEWFYSASISYGTIRVWVDGTEIIHVNGAANVGDGQSLSHIVAGQCIEPVGSETVTAHVDCIAFADAYIGFDVPIYPIVARLDDCYSYYLAHYPTEPHCFFGSSTVPLRNTFRRG